MLQCAFDYACELVFSELVYLLRFSHMLPGLFGGLLQESTRKDTLQKLRDIYETYMALEDASQNDGHFASELKLLVWPHATWVLEVLFCLAEDDFTKVDDLLAEELLQWSRSPRTTQLAEVGFNTLRATASAKSKSIGADRIFHTLVKSPLAKEADRPPSTISGDAKLNATRIDKDAFVAKRNDCFSMDEKLLDHFADSPVSEPARKPIIVWPYGPFELGPADISCLVFASGLPYLRIDLRDPCL